MTGIPVQFTASVGFKEIGFTGRDEKHRIGLGDCFTTLSLYVVAPSIYQPSEISVDRAELCWTSEIGLDSLPLL